MTCVYSSAGLVVLTYVTSMSQFHRECFRFALDDSTHNCVLEVGEACRNV